MLAVNILISFSSAYFCASWRILTSKTNKQAYYFFRFSDDSDKSDFIALITSSLETGPTDICETGIFYYFKYSNRASKDPRVEAATPTPIFSNLIFFFTF